MAESQDTRSKLDLDGDRVSPGIEQAIDTARAIFQASGCSQIVAERVSRHRVDADLCGVESHGLMRTLQYAQQFADGTLNAAATAEVIARDSGVTEVNGNGGIGIPAMDLAVDVACRQSADTGMSVLAIRDVGHTGRLGEFTERAAQSGHLAIVVGGGGREKWRQVAPHGGRQALLPTNPYSIGIRLT